MLTTFPAEVERHRATVGKYWPPELVDKALWIIQYGSKGDPNAIGDNGFAVGLFQIHLFPNRPDKQWLLDPDNNIRYAADNIGGAGGNFSEWGEGTAGQAPHDAASGKGCFGALGNNPFPGEGAVNGSRRIVRDGPSDLPPSALAATEAALMANAAASIASAAIEAALMANMALWGHLEARSTEASSDWPMRTELLGFYLHAADRFVFAKTGPVMRDLLLERATAIAADQLVRLSWHLPLTGEPTAERAAWFARLVNETVDHLDAAGMDYGECRALFDNSFSDEFAIGRLIKEILDVKPGDSVGFDQFMLIATTVPKAMLDSRLIEATSLAADSVIARK